ncbi:hypothetical protein MZG81_25595, partial [Escherichia coli]|nr:hypothetical protein [Escherichia coli]
MFSTRSRFITAKKAPKITQWELLQQLGKNIILTVALFSLCGIILGICSYLNSH